MALVNLANRRLDLDRAGDRPVDRSEVGSMAGEAARVAATATTRYDLCELLLLDFRIEHHFGNPASARSAALGVLRATVARDCTVAASIATLYAADLVARFDPPVAPAHLATVTEAQRIAAAYANDRPGGRSRLLVDNFPALVDTVDPEVDDDAVLRAASGVVDILEALGPAAGAEPSHPADAGATP